MAISYLGKTNKRCWVLESSQDNLVVVQPSVSTYGLNILLLKTENIDEAKMEKIFDLFEKEGIETIKSYYLRRPHQSQGFTLGFKDSDNFIRALEVFYLSEKTPRCQIVMPEKGLLIVQPDRSTSELNTLILEDFDSVVGEEREKIKAKIASLKTIECDMAETLPKTVNF